jgi:hypothetical protein
MYLLWLLRQLNLASIARITLTTITLLITLLNSSSYYSHLRFAHLTCVCYLPYYTHTIGGRPLSGRT